MGADKVAYTGIGFLSADKSVWNHLAPSTMNSVLKAEEKRSSWSAGAKATYKEAPQLAAPDGSRLLRSC